MVRCQFQFVSKQVIEWVQDIHFIKQTGTQNKVNNFRNNKNIIHNPFATISIQLSSMKENLFVFLEHETLH